MRIRDKIKDIVRPELNQLENTTCRGIIEAYYPDRNQADVRYLRNDGGIDIVYDVPVEVRSRGYAQLAPQAGDFATLLFAPGPRVLPTIIYISQNPYKTKPKVWGNQLMSKVFGWFGGI